MNYSLRYLPPAENTFSQLARKDVTKHRRVVKCLRMLAQDPKYGALNSHKYASKSGPNGEEVWESYVENNSPSAWRVFWHYGPGQGVITVVSDTPPP